MKDCRRKLVDSIFFSIFALLFLVCGCAHITAEAIVEESAPRLAEIDSILHAALKNFLPTPEEWPPRVIVFRPEGEPVPLVQAVPVSSLAYFPRLFHRIENAFRKTGWEDFHLQLASSGKQNYCFLRIPVSADLSYQLELYQTVNGKVALIIDDVGYTMAYEDLLLGLDYPLTIAVLPRLSHSREWDRLASSLGFEVILHCPLEAIEGAISPGPGAIRCDTVASEAAAIFSGNLEDVPHAVGVNNHMGSAFTVDTEAMLVLLENLKTRDLFFVDSLTIPETVTAAAAEETGVKYLTRDVFLDHEDSEEFIRHQFQLLKRRAKNRGYAVGIGHYRRLTLEVIAREIPALADDGLQIVPVSALVK